MPEERKQLKCSCGHAWFYERCTQSVALYDDGTIDDEEEKTWDGKYRCPECRRVYTLEDLEEGFRLVQQESERKGWSGRSDFSQAEARTLELLSQGLLSRHTWLEEEYTFELGGCYKVLARSVRGARGQLVHWLQRDENGITSSVAFNAKLVAIEKRRRSSDSEV